jgi:mono/diheme cytochrome c family protein
MKWGVRNHAEIEAITAFLISRVKEPIDMLKYPGNGDIARGKDLFSGNGGLGCLACHSMDENPVDKPARHGPNLSGIGSKTSADWVFTWLKNPKHYRPDTQMPSLRLTDEEAADLTAYLMSKHNAEFENAKFELAPEAAFKAIWLDFLLDKQPLEEAKKTIDAMDPAQRKIDLGKRLVERYGCFGCHKIQGYENANPIGTELSGSQAWGSKDVDKLDFGLLHEKVEHSRNGWFQQKLADTRIFDEGKVKLPLELLKMPKFNLTKDEISDIAVFIQSLVTDKITPEIAERLSPAQQRVEKGRKLVQHYNCRGCHELEYFGGDIQQHIVGVKLADGSPGEDSEYYPPLLNGEGFKTQPEWLFEFLRAPVPLRPWLKARMPTFGFTDEEANAIVTFFNHQEIWQNAADRDLWQKQVAAYVAKNPAYDFEKLAEGRFLSDEDRAKLSPQEQKLLTEYESLTNDQKAERRSLRDMAVARLYRSQGGKFLFDLEWPYRARWDDELKGNDLTEARQLFKDGYQCLRCHPTSLVKAPAGGGLAPNLALAQKRLRSDWIPLWLQNPQALQPGTKMPNNFTYDEETKTWKSSLGDGARHMKLLRDYLFSRDFIENTPVVDR